MSSMKRIVPTALVLISVVVLVGLPNAARAVVSAARIAKGTTIGSASMALITSKGLRCSAVLVGPNVLMTAAHCMGPIQEMSAHIGSETVQIIRCDSLGSEETRIRNIALCLLKDRISAAAPAMIATNAPAVGQRVQLSGFGCGEPGGLDREFGMLRAGEARIVEAEKDLPSALAGGLILAQGRSSACMGDSGGGVFNYEPEPRLIGIIVGSDSEARTYIAPVVNNTAVLVWAQSNHQSICGLTSDRCVTRKALGGSSTLTITPDPRPIDQPINTLNAVARDGETLSSLYVRICGEDAERVAVSTKLLSKISGRMPEERLTEGQLVSMPPCPTEAASSPKAGTTPVAVSTVMAPRALPTLSLSSTDPAARCSGPASQYLYPYDPYRLLDVLRINRRKLPVVAPATVLIADSGMAIAGNGIFPPSLFADRDGNWNAFAARMQPIVDDPTARSHGTEVASVALGGPMFAYVQAYSEGARIRLIALPMYQESDTGTGPVFDSSRFWELIRRVQDRPTLIVNLSLRSSVRIDAIESEINTNPSGALFVVAAGNQGHELSTDGGRDHEEAYPALYGGSNRSRVITVAALDGTGQLAPFSNHSKKYVDIGAPGCQVPVMQLAAGGKQLEPSLRNGTSLAAPLVSFAAALVYSETDDIGPRLKRRLLVSADLDAGPLNEHIADGRRLNILKAAAVNTDVIETRDGVRFGDVEFHQGGRALRDGESVTLQCDETPTLTLHVQEILKLARYGGSDERPNLRIYYQDPDPHRMPANDLCRAAASMDWTLKFREDGSALWEDLPLATLRDFVPRYRR